MIPRRWSMVRPEASVRPSGPAAPRIPCAEGPDVRIDFVWLRPGETPAVERTEGEDRIFIFVAGKASLMIDEERVSVSRGDVVYVPRGALHAVHTGDEVAAYYTVHAS